MCRIGLIVEYSRMRVPSLSSGCEIAQFFVRYMGFGCISVISQLKCALHAPQTKTWGNSNHAQPRSLKWGLKIYPSRTKILEGRTNLSEYAPFKFLGHDSLQSAYQGNAFGKVGSAFQRTLDNNKAMILVWKHPKGNRFDNLPLPNEDLGRMNKRWNADFRVLFKGVSIQLHPIPPKRRFWKDWQNLRLGSIHNCSHHLVYASVNTLRQLHWNVVHMQSGRLDKCDFHGTGRTRGAVWLY